jgi:hypothetical protein
MWAQGAEGRKPHYRCTWSLRGGECPTKRKSLPASLVDGVLGEAVRGLRLAPNWREQMLVQMDTTADDAAAQEAQRTLLGQKLARLRKLLIDGLIEEAEYRTERARLEAELAQMAPPERSVNVEKAAALLANLGTVWDGASPEERKAIAGQLFTAVYCDPDKPEEITIQLDPALHQFWEVLPDCINWVIDGARTHNRQRAPQVIGPGLAA